MDNLAYSFNYRGYTAEIHYDTNAPSPRRDENLGIIYCWSRRIFDGLNESPWRQRGDMPSPEEFARLAEKSGWIYLPLYGFSHGVNHVRTSSFNDRWDSGQIGFIYCTRERAKEFGIETESDEYLRERLRHEVKTLDCFISGAAYGYRILDECGDCLDSCWGFFDTEGKGAEHMVEEMDLRRVIDNLCRHAEEAAPHLPGLELATTEPDHG